MGKVRFGRKMDSRSNPGASDRLNGHYQPTADLPDLQAEVTYLANADKYLYGEITRVEISKCPW